MKIDNMISRPVTALKGSIIVPGDKSISHRAVMFGSIARGVTTIHGFLKGEDCLATIAAFQAMGVKIDMSAEDQVVIHGVGKYGLKKPGQILNCMNSGTTMRLMAGILAGQAFDTQLTGDKTLLKRPMRRICIPLKEMGAEVLSQNGYPPLYIKGGKKLKGIVYQLPEASAQVKSCILLAGLYAGESTTIIETIRSRNHTELMLSAFHYPLKQVDNSITIDGSSELTGTEIDVPGDISSAAFFIVAASIIPDSDITIKNVGVNPTRVGIIEILRLMGADISLLNSRQYGSELIADIRVRYAPLHGIEIPQSLIPLAIDEFPVIFIAAAKAKGETILSGAQELRFKESDRIGVMAEGLRALGGDAEPTEDGIVIQGGQLLGGSIESHHDHRIAMAFAIAGASAESQVIIHHCAAVATSFPNFVEIGKQLGLDLQKQVEA